MPSANGRGSWEPSGSVLSRRASPAVVAALLLSAALSGCGGNPDYSCTDNVCTLKATSQVQLSAATYTASTGAPMASFTVTRTGETDKPVSVRFATADGTGLAGLDYTAGAGTLSWAAGDKSPRSVNVLLKHQQIRRPSRVFGVALSSPSENASLGSRPTAEVTIEGDDAPAAR